MMEEHTVQLFEKACRLILALVFLYSGVAKLLNPGDFSVVIGGYGLLPDWLNFPMAIFLPLVEVLVAGALLFRLRGGISGAAALLIAFIAVLSYGIILGLDVDCGCFGPGDPENAYAGLKTALIRDLGLLAMVCFLAWYRQRNTEAFSTKINVIQGEGQ